MIITWEDSGVFEIKEDDFFNDDEIETIAGVSVGDNSVSLRVEI